MDNCKKKYIKISATDVAGCINKNMYISKDIMILKIWEKYDYDSFINAIKRNNLKIIRLSEINIKIDNKKIDSYLIKYNESKINMKNGMEDRPIIIKTIQDLYNIKVENNKDKYTLFINRPQKSFNQIILHNIIINGIVNNFVEDEKKYIIDIKSRQKEMFNFIQDHEKIQIITYMKLSNIKICKHVEYFKGEIRTEDINYEEEHWKNIEIKLLEFVNYFEKIYYNDLFQDLFFKKKIIDNLVLLEMMANNFGYIIINNNQKD